MLRINALVAWGDKQGGGEARTSPNTAGTGSLPLPVMNFFAFAVTFISSPCYFSLAASGIGGKGCSPQAGGDEGAVGWDQLSGNGC